MHRLNMDSKIRNLYLEEGEYVTLLRKTGNRKCYQLAAEWLKAVLRGCNQPGD